MTTSFYLNKLIIQNFATFKNQSIQFKPGLNAIIGETGSGKSLVLDALHLILGGRADKKIVRKDSDFSLIEAHFICNDQEMKSFLEQEGYPLENNELIIKRLIYKAGSTKNYINHLSCTVNFLGNFSRRWIDLVGQFENQRLLSENYQLHLLDQFGKLHKECKTYQELLVTYKKSVKEYNDLKASQTHRDQRLDYISFQLQEIENLNPSSQDEESLQRKKNLLLNYEKSMKLSGQISELFNGSETQLGMFNLLKSLSTIFRKNLDHFSAEIGNLSTIEDELYSIQRNVELRFNTELDPNELNQVLERLDLYQKLKKKFGGTIETILQIQLEFLKEKNQLDDLDISLKDLDEKIKVLNEKLHLTAKDLHSKRSKYASELAHELTRNIRSLRMDGATIKIELSHLDEFSESGMSKVHLMAETNKGEGFFKIKDIASGGELSRTLLALRQILSSNDSISIFLFDEIDTGIGGETANCIGSSLKEVSRHGQVVTITHLPQIAQFADNLIAVSKLTLHSDEGDRTESTVKEIFGKTIAREVKSMSQLHHVSSI